MNFRISIKSVIAILSMAILIMASSSCSRFGKSKGQSIEFATFIKAYTGGVVSDKSTIRVELASDIPEAMAGTDLKDDIHTVSQRNGQMVVRQHDRIHSRDRSPETGAVIYG